MQESKDILDLKEKILYLIKTDKEFAFELHKAILKEYGDELVTKTYLDEALVKLSEEFDKKLAKLSEEFDRKLAKLSEEFDRKLAKLSEEFDRKLAKQSEEFDRKLAKLSEELRKEFYTALEKQSEEFDKKLAKLSEELRKEFYTALEKQSEEFDKKLGILSKDLKGHIDRKISVLGERWGIRAEVSISKFAKELIKEWGGIVRKWIKHVPTKIGEKEIMETYEIDIVITNGKIIAVEVKSSRNTSEVIKFLKAVYIYEEEIGRKTDEKIIVTFYIYDDAKKLADEYNIKVITM